MKIVIAGAGDVGFHLAELLTYENQDIILIDKDREVLEYASSHLDVLTLPGDSSSIHVLEQAGAAYADLVLAVTTSEKNNLVTAILAKKMGARQTVARVMNQEYLEPQQRKTFAELGVDNIISPRDLAAQEILRLLRQCTFTDIFEFEKGKISLVGLTVDDDMHLANKKVSEINGQENGSSLKPVALLRGHRTLIPSQDTVIRRNDHLYFITQKNELDNLVCRLGKSTLQVRNVMIVGGTAMGYATAKRLEGEFAITLIERDKDRCKLLSEHLGNTLVIHGEYSDFELMEEEGLQNMDAFIALTPNAETNIIACLTAKNHGVNRTIAQVENKEYVHISQNIGVDTLINRKLIAANNIFRFVRKGQVEAITSLHGVDAEIIEFGIHKKNRVTKQPLRSLHIPKGALIAGVIRGEESLIPDEDFQLQVDDKVIVFALPQSISRLEKLFH